MADKKANVYKSISSGKKETIQATVKPTTKQTTKKKATKSNSVAKKGKVGRPKKDVKTKQLCVQMDESIYNAMDEFIAEHNKTNLSKIQKVDLVNFAIRDYLSRNATNKKEYIAGQQKIVDTDMHTIEE